MLRTFELQRSTPYLLDGVLSNVAFAIRSTFHTSLNTTPASLVYGRDMFFPTQYVANWPQIRMRRQEQIDKATNRENQKRKSHDFKVGDLVLLRNDGSDGAVIPKLERPTLGPFEVTRVFVNGTLELHRRGFRERVNIRRVIPYRVREP